MGARASGALAVLVVAGGCAATTYRPTEPRPAQGPGVVVDVVSIRGAAHEAEVSIRTQQPTWIGPVSWASGDVAACNSTQTVTVGRRPEANIFEALPAVFEVAPDDLVFVDLGARPEMARPGLFLDFTVRTQTEQGCLRLRLTGTGDEILWRADRSPWIVSFGVRVDDPLTSLEGTGGRLTTELRVLHTLGPVRGFFGFTFGGATCRGADCPPLVLATDDDEQSTGLFFHFGTEVGLERRVAIGRWSLGLTVGGSISIFQLGAHDDYQGGRSAGVAGPFASLSLFGPSGGAIPGFSPAARRRSSGPEVFLQRQTAFGRGPTESAWVAGLGWRFEGTN